MVFRLIPQKFTLNSVSQAGQVISRSPGLLFMRSLRSHDGHAISILGRFGLITKCVWHDEHCRFAGLRSTPETRTLEHSGQPTFSSRHFLLVPSCSTATFALHITHVMMPKPLGSKFSQRGQDKSGGAILDSIPGVSSSSVNFNTSFIVELLISILTACDLQTLECSRI